MVGGVVAQELSVVVHRVSSYPQPPAGESGQEKGEKIQRKDAKAKGN
jgi:hypothetical protein